MNNSSMRAMALAAGEPTRRSVSAGQGLSHQTGLIDRFEETEEQEQ